MTTKNPLLALDGDESVLRCISQVACPYFEVFTTRDPRKLIGWLDHFPNTAVVVTEHVLQTSSGVALLESVRTMRPGARRVLLTTYHDLSSIVEGLHSGAIERLVSKPFTHSELLNAILPENLSAAQGKRASA